MGQPEDPGAPGIVVLPWPLVVSGLHDVIRSPRCACPLRGRSGSMCVEAHYLATDAAAGRAEKKRISPGFQKSNDLSRLTAD